MFGVWTDAGCTQSARQRGVFVYHDANVLVAHTVLWTAGPCMSMDDARVDKWIDEFALREPVDQQGQAVEVVAFDIQHVWGADEDVSDDEDDDEDDERSDESDEDDEDNVETAKHRLPELKDLEATLDGLLEQSSRRDASHRSKPWNHQVLQGFRFSSDHQFEALIRGCGGLLKAYK